MQITYFFIARLHIILQNLFFALLGVFWTMPNSIRELFTCWNRDRLNKKHYKIWNKLSMLFGGLFGQKRIAESLKATRETFLTLSLELFHNLFFGSKCSYVQDVDALLEVIQDLHNFELYVIALSQCCLLSNKISYYLKKKMSTLL